jgi:drug/metabolite transporter (DMT)-like permease
LGWFIWSETVSLRTIIGILIIVSAGIFILYREKIKEQEITTDQPLR